MLKKLHASVLLLCKSAYRERGTSAGLKRALACQLLIIVTVSGSVLFGEQAMDGKITLDRIQLKDLRRNLGISQEQLALQCAERRLCVSVASIKRAETSKNILYRTARDIARFYDVDVDELIVGRSSSQLVSTTDEVATLRQVVVLRCCWPELPPGQSSDTLFADWGEDLLLHYRAHRIDGDENEYWLVFGSDGVQGTEALQACYFVLATRRGLEERGLDAPRWLIASAEIANDADLHNGVHAGHTLLSAPFTELSAYADSDEVLIDSALDAQLRNHFSGATTEIPQLPHSFKLSLQDSRWQSSLSLVGRHVELIQFRAILDSSISFGNASTHVVTLNGVAGIGKSRLLHEFAALAAADGVSVLQINILDFGDRQQHQLLPQLTRQLLGLSSTAQDTDELLRLIENVLPDGKSQLAIALTMLGWTLSEQHERLVGATPHDTLLHRQVLLASALLRGRAVGKPHMLMIEDMHWADDRSRQFLLELLSLVDELPLIIALTYRPEVSFDHDIIASNAALAVTTFNLTPLNADAANAFATQFQGVDERYRNRCIEKSQGNPLFLEYLLRDGRSVQPNDEAQLPFSVQAIVGARVQQLSDADHQALLAAAAIGQHFDCATLLAVLKRDDYDPRALLDQHLVSRRGNSFQFNHALIHEGVYQSIIERDRRKLHLRCAEIYREKNLAQAVIHFHRARSEHISKYFNNAIVHLVDAFQYERALELIVLGEQIDYTDIDRFTLRIAHADILVKLGRVAESVDAAGRAQRAAANASQTVRSLLVQASGLNTLDRFNDALERIEQAEAIAQENRLLAQLARIYGLKGNFYFPRGDVNTCFNYQQKSLSFATKTTDPELEARALGGLGDAAYAQGKMYSAYDYFSRCLQLCESHGFTDIEAANLFMRSTVRIYQNQYQAALQDALRSVELAEQVGEKRAEIVSRLTAGWLLLDSLQLDAAGQQIETGIALAESIGARRFVPFLRESEARLFQLQENSQRARAVIENALQEVDDLKAHSFIGPWLLGTKALLCTTSREGESCLQQGRALLEKGCIGHNYFRFHVAAMEFGLSRKKPQIIAEHRRLLEQFTEGEPTPWSSFYIKRAELVTAEHNDSSGFNTRLDALLETARRAGLLTALPLLEGVENRVTPTV